MSGFEIITITFSFIVGLGMAQVLRSLAFVVRERGPYRLHWIPFSVAGMVIFFQVQFWFGLAVVNSVVGQWNWPVYGLMLGLAMLIFLAGATVLPPPNRIGERDLIEDFETEGRISLLLLAVYLVGWIVLGLMYRIPELWHLALVNGLMAVLAVVAWARAKGFPRTWLHLAMLALTVYGAVTVWTRPDFQAPWA